MSKILSMSEEIKRLFRQNGVLRQARRIVTRTSRSARVTGISCFSAIRMASSISVPGMTPNLSPNRFWKEDKIRLTISVLSCCFRMISLRSNDSHRLGCEMASKRLASNSTQTQSGCSCSMTSLTKSTDSCDTWAVPIRITVFPYTDRHKTSASYCPIKPVGDSDTIAGGV